MDAIERERLGLGRRRHRQLSERGPRRMPKDEGERRGGHLGPAGGGGVSKETRSLSSVASFAASSARSFHSILIYLELILIVLVLGMH